MPPSGTKSFADVVVIGGGAIGMSIALEMHRRGASVTLVERDTAMAQASTAAAGMLAAEDPGNPPELLPLARLSVQLYPAFLSALETQSGIPVPFQTNLTWQYGPDGKRTRLAEHSIDPRQLAAALLAAVQSTPIRLLEHTTIDSVTDTPAGLALRTGSGAELFAGNILHAAGAWSGDAMLKRLGCSAPVTPRKGQMLRVRLTAPLTEVHRNEHVYIVPRTLGPQAGTAIIGATVEDAGFDLSVHPGDLARLREIASKLIPQVAEAPLVEAWAGLRPATPDALPVLGQCGPHRWIATGHYRNGVLLAPATAVVIADLLTRNQAAVNLRSFAPDRFLL
jgi:glycine oxidase